MNADKSPLASLVRQFVEIYSSVADTGLDLLLHPSPGFIPLTSNETKNKAAKHFLLAAALSDSELTGNARNIRILLDHLQSAFGESLYTITNPATFQPEVAKCELRISNLDSLGPKKGEIPEVLASANSFVANKAQGNLVAYSSDLKSKGLRPADLAKTISYSIKRMGGHRKAKVWLYLRWMIRKPPDLGIFDFDAGDLLVPLSSPKLRVAVALELIDNEDLALELNARSKPASWWRSTAEFDEAQEALTCYARTLFSDDPAKVDFPFFILGTFMEGFDLTPASLEKCLKFFVDKYSELQKPPLRYLTAVPHYNVEGYLIPEMGAFGGFENEVHGFLRNRQIKFDYEFLEFQLPRKGDVLWESPTYTPDFLLSQMTLKGRKLILEPHGVREGLPLFLAKLSVFREFYGEHFAVALVVPDDFMNLVAEFDPNREAYDLLWRRSSYKSEIENYRST